MNGESTTKLENFFALTTRAHKNLPKGNQPIFHSNLGMFGLTYLSLYTGISDGNSL
jgi:hypothetical protein